jgi:flagellar motility protein MotE (MotC chaperone)
VTAARLWRAATIFAPRPRRCGWVEAVLLVLGGLIAFRLGLMLAGALDLSPPPARGPAVMAELAPAPEWLPEPAAGPEAALAEPSIVELPEPAAGPEAAAPAPSTAPAGALPEAAGEAPAPPVALDPANLTPSEIAVLHQLAARRAALDRREREIDQRAALIEGAAADLDQQLARLSTLRDEIAAAIGAHDAAEEARLASLVKIYETMKPKAAAEIFDRLEMPVLIEVVERMRAVKSADVLARMDPVKAKQVTSELARRSELLEADRAPTGAAPGQSRI